MNDSPSRHHWRIGLRSLLALCLLLLLSPAHTLAAPAPLGRSASAPCRGTLEVLGADATVSLVDTPENGIVRFTVPIKTTVLGITARRVGTTTWCLISIGRGGPQGWLPASQLRPPA